MDTSFPFSTQIPSLFLLYGFTPLLAFSYSASFQTHKFTYGIFLAPTFSLPPLTLLLLLFCSISLIILPHFLLSSSSLFLVFSSSSFLFSSSFCFYHPDFPYFSLYCLPHFTEHLVIFTSSVLQLISELWYASHIISKITLHFCLPIIFFSIFYNSAQSGQIFHSYNNFSLCACPLHKSLFSFFLLLFAEDI